MGMFSQFPFGGGASVAIAPVDLAAAAAASLWANMRDVNDFMWGIVYLGAGAAGEHATITLQQARTNAGGNAKALTIKEVWYKRGSAAFTNANSAAQDKWVKSGVATREAAVASYVTTADRVTGLNHFMAGFRISKSDLDNAGGFNYVQLNIADVGATAQLGFALWLPEGFAYSNSPISLLT